MTRDLLFQDEVRQVVSEAYRSIPSGGGLATAHRFYTPSELAEVPPEACEWSLGVGNPVRRARLRPGEVVLDVGCGGGIDSVLAARRVGPLGTVIAVDVLDEMCRRTTDAAHAAGVGSLVQCRQGLMEELPVEDGSVDVVISNGALNLSPRKARAFAELARVLRPGGRLCVADLTVDSQLPPEVLTSDAAWAG